MAQSSDGVVFGVTQSGNKGNWTANPALIVTFQIELRGSQVWSPTSPDSLSRLAHLVHIPTGPCIFTSQTFPTFSQVSPFPLWPLYLFLYF